MSYDFYRGDTRSKDTISNDGGFKARAPLNQTQAINLIKRFDGVSTEKVDLPLRASRLKDRLDNKLTLKDKKGMKVKDLTAKLLQLVRFVKEIRDGTSVQISTDLTEDCGGYASRNIYKIQFDSLYLHDNGPTKPGRLNPNTLEVTSHFDAKLITDTGHLATAKVIAITSKGNEVFFLTSIPINNIVMHKPKGDVWKVFRE